MGVFIRRKPLRLSLIIFVADHRALFDLPANLPSLQSKYHIAGSLKESIAPFPAYVAPAMLQSNELLFHFPAAVGADFVAVPFLLRCRLGIWWQRFFWQPIFFDTGIIAGQFGKELLMHFLIGNPYTSGDDFLIHFVCDDRHRLALRDPSMFPVILTDRFKHPICNFSLVLLPQIRIGPVGLRLSFISE